MMLAIKTIMKVTQKIGFLNIMLPPKDYGQSGLKIVIFRFIFNRWLI